MSVHNRGKLACLALLSDGVPRTAVAIFRLLYESKVSPRLTDELPPSRQPGARFSALIREDLIEAVHDRQNSFFVTDKGRALWRDASSRLDGSFPGLVLRLTKAIENEIGDPRQARMFAENRLANVWQLLSDLRAQGRHAGRAELLRLAIHERLAALLEAPPREGHGFMKAVHDQVTDYYYSRLMALCHEDEHVTDIDLASLLYTEVSPGLWHGQLRTKSRHGPLFVNVLRVDPKRARLQVEDVSRREKSDRFITAIASRTGAKAVVSAGYFIYSEKGYALPTRQFDPVGLCLVDGRLTQPPVFRRGSILILPGAVRFSRIGLGDTEVCLPDGPERIGSVNAAPEVEASHRLSAYNNVWGRAVVARPGEILLTVVNGAIAERGEGQALAPLNGFVLRVPPRLARSVRELPEGALPMRLADTELRAARYAVAAGPMLLDQGGFAMSYASEDFQEGTPPVTFSGDRTIDRNLIPRCGVGTTADGTAILAIVDGRQPHLSVGATLIEFATLMARLGCTTALNLDGGGTAAMQVGDRVVSNPSTSVTIDARGRAQPASGNEGRNVRPLATAILVR